MDSDSDGILDDLDSDGDKVPDSKDSFPENNAIHRSDFSKVMMVRLQHGNKQPRWKSLFNVSRLTHAKKHIVKYCILNINDYCYCNITLLSGSFNFLRALKYVRC